MAAVPQQLPTPSRNGGPFPKMQHQQTAPAPSASTRKASGSSGSGMFDTFIGALLLQVAAAKSKQNQSQSESQTQSLDDKLFGLLHTTLEGMKKGALGCSNEEAAKACATVAD